MSISIYKRALGCLYLIKHEFDIDGTVDHVIKELADEPKMRSAKYPRKLARNLVTIGGNGDQQEMNLAAFKDALHWYDKERHQNLVNQHRREMEELKAQLVASEERAHSLERDYRRMVQRALGEGSVTAPEPEAATV